MDVLGISPSHDGAIAFVSDGELMFSLEGEKDSFDRNGPVTAATVTQAMQLAPRLPDILALGGWYKILPGHTSHQGAGYHGVDPGLARPSTLFGESILVYESTHERSHIAASLAMSPFDTTGDIAVLVWEGQIGSWYLWNGATRALRRSPVLSQPGGRYAAMFALADPTFADSGQLPPASAAGKLMAIAGLTDGDDPSPDSRQVVDALLRQDSVYPFNKARLARSSLYNAGITNPEVARAAAHLSRRIYEIFVDAAHQVLPAGLPLVVGGGCGLNCDWNHALDNEAHFTSVFVPPCPNDSGSAIGTAVDAAFAAGEPFALAWNVYCGSDFVEDVTPSGKAWDTMPLNLATITTRLQQGHVVAWVEGRAEIGPRALGHRSLLADPTLPESKERLNRMKRRDSYRPIAPMCLSDELGTHFDDSTPDPHMLRFRRVRDPKRLPAIAHTDRSARVQSVTASTGTVFDLLTEMRTERGMGVLCNTSLNFPGKGFIGRTSDLIGFADDRRLDTLVVNRKMHLRRSTL